MKRVKKKKKVLIKRIFIELKQYDYLYKDSVTAKNIIESTNSRYTGTRFEKAEWYISLLYGFKRFLKNKHLEKIIYIIIGILIKYMFDNFNNWFF